VSNFVKAWTDEMFNRLKELMATGISATQVALQINREFGTSFSRNSVIGKAHRAKLDFVGAHACTIRRKLAKPPAAPKIKRPPPVPFNPVKFKPEPLPPPTQLTLDPALHCDLMTLGDDQCHWMVGDRLYCGAVVSSSRKSYCSIHSAVAQRPPTVRQEQHLTRAPFSNTRRRSRFT
jgi:hypothetical protein